MAIPQGIPCNLSLDNNAWHLRQWNLVFQNAYFHIHLEKAYFRQERLLCLADVRGQKKAAILAAVRG
jgi:hypothetical protein